jgi:pimeloyl-ACP methyl ester carboxylesterase
MPEIRANGIGLSYKVEGEGEPVLLVCGTGQAMNTWDLFQVPGLVAGGYRVITFENRGMPPSECPDEPYTVGQMAADAAGLIEALELAPCRVAGLSLGALITQELALARPDLVRCAAMMGTIGRQSEGGKALTASWIEFDRSGVTLPPLYDVMSQLAWLFSPSTLADDDFVKQYLAFAAMGQAWEDPGRIGQHLADQAYDNRLEALSGITVPTMVVTFELDMLTLAPFGREVAAAIPGCTLVEIPGVGHAGPLENPDLVNATLLQFFGAH